MIAVGTGMLKQPATFAQSCMTYAFRAAAGNLFYRSRSIKIGSKGPDELDRMNELGEVAITDINGESVYSLDPNQVVQVSNVDEIDNTVFINSQQGLEEILSVYDPQEFLFNNAKIITENPQIINNLMNIQDPKQRLQQIENIMNGVTHSLQYPNETEKEEPKELEIEIYQDTKEEENKVDFDKSIYNN